MKKVELPTPVYQYQCWQCRNLNHLQLKNAKTSELLFGGKTGGKTKSSQAPIVYVDNCRYCGVENRISVES